MMHAEEPTPSHSWSMASQAPTSKSSFWGRREKVVVTAAGVALAAYVALKVYNPSPSDPATSAEPSTSSPSSSSNPKSFFSRLRSVVSNYANAIASTSDTCATIASDLQAFLTSESNELPRSLKQLAKLVQSDEVQASLRTSVETVAAGASQAFAQASTGPSSLDTVLEALLSDRGRSLVGLAVGVASKNATSSFCEFLERMQASQPQMTTQSSLEAVVQVLTSENGNKLLSLLIAKSIKSGMSAYVEATSGYNMYEDMLSSISKPEHRDAVSDIMTRITAAFIKEVAIAYRKASMQPANLRPQIHDVSAGAWEDPSRSGSMDESMLLAHVPESLLPTRPPLQQSHVKIRSSCAVPLKQNAPKAQPTAWVKQVADLAKEKDVRALVVDVASSATREATRGMVETLISVCSIDAGSIQSRIIPAASASIHALLSILFVLMVFALSPRAITAV